MIHTQGYLKAAIFHYAWPEQVLVQPPVPGSRTKLGATAEEHRNSPRYRGHPQVMRVSHGTQKKVSAASSCPATMNNGMTMTS